jgi:hypothetical protein
MNSQRMKNSEDEILIAVQKLYPFLTEAESRQAAQNFRRYVEIVYEIQCKEEEFPTPTVDNAEAALSIKERSNSLKS